MIYLLIFLGVIILLFIKAIYDEKVNLKKIRLRLEKQWGAVPVKEYSSENLESIKKYYRSHIEENDVDDITWNDLDMDNIFMLLNNTGSSIGEEYLFDCLRKLQWDTHVLKERNRLIEFFQKSPDKRRLLQINLAKLGKFKNISFYEYITSTEAIPKDANWKHYLSILGLVTSVASIFLQATSGIMLTIFFVIYNIMTYYRRKANIEHYLNVFSYILKLMDSVKEIIKLDIPEISEYNKNLKKAVGAFKSFEKGSKLVISGHSMGGDLTDTIIDYFRMLFHIDLIKFNQMEQNLTDNIDKLEVIFQQIGTLDSMMGVASFRTLLENRYCLPQLTKDTKAFLRVEEMYHPVIENPVTNSISPKKCVLITGSNASGKSTFLKTVAINAILAQTIYTCLAKSYEGSYCKVFSSMALRDDILSKESYYIVEIKSLKRILNHLDPKMPMLCFVDEVLRGTNTLERIAASSQILKSLSQNNALCFAATHDIELANILVNHYENYHFQEQIKEDTIIFDYLLQNGKAVSRNAIRLLSIMGYQETIIKQATEEANKFMESGGWHQI